MLVLCQCSSKFVLSFTKLWYIWKHFENEFIVIIQFYNRDYIITCHIDSCLCYIKRSHIYYGKKEAYNVTVSLSFICVPSSKLSNHQMLPTRHSESALR